MTQFASCTYNLARQSQDVLAGACEFLVRAVCYPVQCLFRSPLKRDEADEDELVTEYVRASAV